MKQIEVTTTVKQSLEEIDNILLNQGFKLIRKSRVEDRYMTQNINELTKDNILDVLQKCILIRYLCVDNDYTARKLTYKKKVFDGDTFVSEEKINVNIDDLNKAEYLLTSVGFEKLVDVNYDVIVYQKDKIELAFQQVEGLGLLLEYENSNDFAGYSSDEIIEEKKKMLDEIKKYNIDITDDFDIKKASELVLKRFD